MDSVYNSSMNITQYLSLKTIKRREYGTPVETIDHAPIIQQSYDVFFTDNGTNGTDDRLQNRKKNRRKLRQRNEKKPPGESSRKGSLQGNQVENMMSTLSLQEQSDKKSKQKSDNLLTDGVVHKKDKKSKSLKRIKVQNVEQNLSQIDEKMDKNIKGSAKLQDSQMRSRQVSKREVKNRDAQRGSLRQKKLDVSNSEKVNGMFTDYISKEEVDSGLKNGDLIQGYLRINAKDYKMAYVNNPNKNEQDIFIESVIDRNRAFDGDLVVVKLKPEYEWRGQQKTAFVVYILEKLHPRTAVGVLKLMADKNMQYALFHPRDSKIPRIKIPFTDWPALFYDNADKYENVMFLAKVKEWNFTKFAIGNILENIGMSGDLKTETIAILKEYCLDVTPYSSEMKKFFPSSGEISEAEYEYRIDLRKECIFTIDPLTARDLDDAVSCKALPNGNYEIGVHISDVTYYLKEGNVLNEIVEQRATSTYMVESVYHMLPKELCMICSLLPGEDKLAFSVFWEITPEGKVLNHKFSRTVINSCSQLAYEHAQGMLENPDKIFSKSELPSIYNGYASQDLSKAVNILHKIATHLRKSRFENGALRIDQPKLSFSIDPASCIPLSYSIYENKESHRLIEEFMLLANITVANRLRNDYPDIAFLRSHPSPSEIMTLQLQKLLETVGIHIDITSAGGFQKSLWSYIGDDLISQARMLVLNALCAKTMTRAHYFCPNNSQDEESYWHYALSIPIYTHFTSPIRRYADIMVHRLLCGSLKYTEKPVWDIDTVCQIAANCNKQKFNAKRAGEQSIELYLVHYIGLHQPMIEEAVVLEVRNTSIDVIVMCSGLICKINLNVSYIHNLCAFMY